MDRDDALSPPVSEVPVCLRESIDRVLRALDASLAQTPLGVYLFGSAVLGGLHPDSDVDLLVLVSQPPGEGERRALVGRLLAVSGPAAAHCPQRPVELTVVDVHDVAPWRFPPRNQLVYGEWLRPELERGVLAPPGPDPDLAIVLSTARERSIPLAGPPAHALLPPVPPADLQRAMAQSLPSLIAGMRGDERNVILTLARMWVTLGTGQIVPKDVAAALWQPHLPAALTPTLELARRAYRGECVDHWAARQAEVDAFVAHASREIDRLLAGAGD